MRVIMFEYECSHCSKELRGSFGDNVYCGPCNKTYETGWDYIGEESMGVWLTGNEFNGKVNIG